MNHYTMRTILVNYAVVPNNVFESVIKTRLTDTEYEVSDVGWLIHEEGEWRFVSVSGAACSVDLWRPIATKDKRRKAPASGDNTELLRHPLRLRELTGGWFSREVEPKVKKGKPDSFRLTGKMSGCKDVWFSRDGKLFGEIEVGKTLRQYLKGDFTQEQVRLLESWHARSVSTKDAGLSLLSVEEYALCHKVAEAFSAYRKVASKQYASFFGKEAARVETSKAKLRLIEVREEVINALTGGDPEFKADEESLDSRMKHPDDPYPDRDFEFLYGDMDPSGFEGADWLDKLLYGSVNYKVKGQINEVRIGISGSLHPMFCRNGHRLADEYTKVLRQCEAGVKCGTDRAEVESFFKKHVLRMVTEWINSADPYERAELFARYADVRRSGKRAKLEAPISYKQKEKGADKLGSLVKELVRQLENKAELVYKTKHDFDLPDVMSGEEIEDRLVSRICSAVREANDWTEK